MDKYFASKKVNREIDLDLQREIDEKLRNYKSDVELSYRDRDDLSEYDPTPLKNYQRDLNDSMSSSMNLDNQPWMQELRRANEERDQVLRQVEYDFKIAGMANKNQLFEYDYEKMEYKPLVLNNEIIAEDKIQDIRQAIQEKPAEFLISPELSKNRTGGAVVNNFVNNDYGIESQEEEYIPPTNIENEYQSNSNYVNEENEKVLRRFEKAAMDREINQMEKEDNLSMRYERHIQQEKFKNRLFCLPESFTVYKEQPSRLASLEFNGSRLKFAMPKIPKPITNPKEQLLETSKTEIDKLLLNKITNKKRSKVNYQKINEKDKVLLAKNKFDAGLANSKVNPLNREKEEKSFPALKKLGSRESQAILPQKTLSDKMNRLNESVDKGYAKSMSLTRWILNKSMALYLKLAKPDQNEMKNAMKDMNSFPLDKIFYDEIVCAAIDQTPFTEIDPELEEQEGAVKSLEYFVSRVQNKNLRKLEIKMEHLSDVKGVDRLKSLQLLTLSMNKIQEIREINSLKNIIEIDLSQNNIKSMKGLSNLKYLRQLNLEVNQLTRIEDLEGCELLEVLNLNNNQISKIEGLQGLKRLKKLFLFRNKITKMDGIENLVWLEELDLGRNLIREIVNLQKLPVLRKLILYFNLIDKLPQNFSHISLSEIWLNGNKLVEISDFAFLPSLKFLNLQENEIMTLTKNSLMFLPNLKSLNLSFNKIASFGQVYRLLVHFSSIQQIDLGENLFLRGTTETVRAFYESILLTLMPNLMELNSKKITERTLISSIVPNTMSESLYLYSGRLENDMNHIDKVTSSKLNRNKGSFYTQSRQIMARASIGLFYLSKIGETSSLVQGEVYVLDHKFSYDIHISAFKYKEALHKIKSMLLKLVYKKRLRKKHFKKNVDKIVKIQAAWRGYRTRKVYSVSNIMKKKRQHAHFLSLAKYALKIQKVYRGYKTRWRIKLHMKKYDDDDDLEGFNEEIVLEEPDYDAFKLKVPENFNLRQFVPSFKAQEPVRISGNNIGNIVKPREDVTPLMSNKKQPNIIVEDNEDSKQDDEYSVISGHSGRSLQTIRLKPTKPNVPKAPVITQEQKEQIVNEWGFKDENVKKAFEYRLNKNAKRKEKKKDLTAEERYQKFLSNTRKLP